MKLFKVMIDETESLDVLKDGKWVREYAWGVGYAINRSPKVAYRLAQERMRRKLAESADRVGFNGIGGTPILRCVTIEKDGKIIFSEY